MPNGSSVETKITEVLLRLEERLIGLEKKFDLIQDYSENSSADDESRKSDSISGGVNSNNEHLFIARMNEVDRKLDELYLFTQSQLNQRTLTLEWLMRNIGREVSYLLELVSADLCKSEARESEIIQKLAAYPKYEVVCASDCASAALDNIEPESTFEGIVSRPLFVLACERIASKDKLNFLDIGCGGGAIVFDFIKRGHFAVGIDGSTACRKMNVGYWNHIEHLHTCDVTSEFKFIGSGEAQLRFDVISMWEVFEHIPEDLCPSLLNNVYSNLADDGIFVGSISKLEYVSKKTGVPYHITIKDLGWWERMFSENGFEFINSDFRNEEFCRGVGDRYQDLHNYVQSPEMGFQFTARKITNFIKD